MAKTTLMPRLNPIMEEGVLHLQGKEVVSEHYLQKILAISHPYLKQTFNQKQLATFLEEIQFVFEIKERETIIKNFSETYIKSVKKIYQNQYKKSDQKLNQFIEHLVLLNYK